MRMTANNPNELDREVRNMSVIGAILRVNGEGKLKGQRAIRGWYSSAERRHPLGAKVFRQPRGICTLFRSCAGYLQPSLHPRRAVAASALSAQLSLSPARLSLYTLDYTLSHTLEGYILVAYTSASASF